MCNSSRKIIIFEITTEFEGGKDNLKSFGPNIMLHPRVSIIRMRPVNQTLMSKCLNDILRKEGMQSYIAKNWSSMVRNIVNEENGDLRNAIQTLQMRVIQISYPASDSETEMNDGIKENKNKKKSKKKKSLSLRNMKNIGGREDTLSLFHSLGKILYAKKTMTAEEAVEKSDLDCVLFNDLLYENFADFFIYNLHFNPKLKQVDHIFDDLFTDTTKANDDLLFDKYCTTLNYFSDADICSKFYQRLRFSDSSTDMKSGINHPQFGAQLYPAMYCTSIASRGYLIAHSKPVKLKNDGNDRNSKHRNFGFHQFRGSSAKLCWKLKQELKQFVNETFVNDVDDGNTNDNENNVRMCISDENGFYLDIFPMIAMLNDSYLANQMEMSQKSILMIEYCTQYSTKYEVKKMVKTRFEQIQQSYREVKKEENVYRETKKSMKKGDEHEKIEEIEEFTVDFFAEKKRV